jgi:hypothetical protein
VDAGIATAIGTGLAGIAGVSVIDRIIDASSHAHATGTYRLAMKPSATAAKVWAGASLALMGVGLLASANDRTKPYASTIAKVGAGVGVGLLATVAWRSAWGLAVAPAQAGWKPGVQATQRLRLGDLAANAVDRVHMMGREPELTGRNWKLFDTISKLQGHGPLTAREAAGEFAPVLRYQGVRYRTQLRTPVELLDPAVPLTPAAAARR